MFITGKAATRIIFVVTKLLSQHVCHYNKNMLIMTKRLSQQNYVCCDKIFLLWQGILLSRQRHVLSQQRYLFVTTKILVCHNKYMSRNNFCHNKHNSVMTRCVLSWQTHFRRDTKLLSWQKNETCGSSHKWYMFRQHKQKNRVTMITSNFNH